MAAEKDIVKSVIPANKLITSYLEDPAVLSPPPTHWHISKNTNTDMTVCVSLSASPSHTYHTPTHMPSITPISNAMMSFFDVSSFY